ncbi:MAG: DUF1587 domain-containing protein [Planctomycetaceae bacterium]
MIREICRRFLTIVICLAVCWSSSFGNDVPLTNQFFQSDIVPVLRRACLECHNADLAEADVDLSIFQTVGELKSDLATWIKVRAMLETQQMPPKDAPPLTDAERLRLETWVRLFLKQQAKAQAGDPGPVVLRRLSNAEYTYTIQDLTSLATLHPADEFPVDGAAGEGFTNVGSGLVMSPSLVQKYLDAAKEVADHAALLPTGIRFSPYKSDRDQTDDLLARIRDLYALYSTTGNGTAVDLQGIRFETNQGGVLPVADYIAATVSERPAVLSGRKTVADVARERKLSPVYLQRLWRTLTAEPQPKSFLLQRLRDRWQTADADDVPVLVQQIADWQPVLWKFNVVGHVGREGAPASWMEAVSPAAERQEFRIAIPKAEDGKEAIVRLTASDAGDGNTSDYVLWQDARLEAAGQPSVKLRDVQGLNQQMQIVRQDMLTNVVAYLPAVDDLTNGVSVDDAAERHSVKAELLNIWASYLGVSGSGVVDVSGHLANRLPASGTYDFIKGWGVPETPSIVANSSDQAVRIPGLANPHSLMMHPSVTDFVALGWRSPVTGRVQIKARIADAHADCGNGFEWFLQHRRGTGSEMLAQGMAANGAAADFSETTILVTQGELISVIIGPGNSDHVCDLTAVDLTITELEGALRSWDAAKDLSPDILAGNPHADSHGHPDTWHFYRGSMQNLLSGSNSLVTVPAGSLLDRWRQNAEQRAAIAKQLAAFIADDPAATQDSTTPDDVLRQQLQSLPVPFGAISADAVEPDLRFGMHPLGHSVDAQQLIIQAPASLEFRIPAAFADRELVVTGTFDPIHGQAATVQLSVSANGDAVVANDLTAGTILCAESGEARQRVLAAFADFRELFPIALCYTRIVPVDEVVTATLFHREDQLYQRLMLTDAQAAELDQLWDELLYVSQEPLKLVVALEQIREFSTQDRPEMVEPWDKMKPAVLARAEAFRSRVLESEPSHLDAVLEFADRAWRRPLTAADQETLRNLYRQLRDKGLAHPDAIRLLIARVLTSPAFLYRLETPGDGPKATAVTDVELANRLSYFLWSTLPDAELRAAAAASN